MILAYIIIAWVIGYMLYIGIDWKELKEWLFPPK
jgi:hypothetical protein